MGDYTSTRQQILEIAYRYLYRQGGLITDDPGELASKQARRVRTNLEVADFDTENGLFRDAYDVRIFFTTKGENVELKRCPSCRATYDPEFAHECTYE